MIDETIDLLVYLENTMTSFYSRIKNLSRLAAARPVLEFMEMHSYAHTEKIEEAREKYPKPVLKRELVINFENNLTKNVFEAIQNETDITKVLKDLADSEESLSLLYRSMSAYMMKISNHYKDVADFISSLAEDEMSHRNLLMHDRKKIMHSLANPKSPGG